MAAQTPAQPHWVSRALTGKVRDVMAAAAPALRSQPKSFSALTWLILTRTGCFKGDTLTHALLAGV